MKKLLLLLLLLWSHPAFAAITFVQGHLADGACANPCTTQAATFTSNVTNGNRVVAALVWCGDVGCGSAATTLSSLVGSANIGTFALDICQTATANRSLCLYSAPVTGTGAATITATFSGDTWYANVRIAEVSFDGLSIKDQTGESTGMDTTHPVSTSGATTVASEIAFATISNATFAPTTPAGYTNVGDVFFVYKILTATGVETATWTNMSDTYWNVIATYKINGPTNGSIRLTGVGR